MKRKTISIGGTIVLAVALVWCGIAVARLRHTESEFAKARTSGSDEFFVSASLCAWQSLRPLIKNPFRSDIRLYFDHVPKINRGSHDAWASNETGEWRPKIHN
jgi:hypothetical protein